MYPLKKPHKYAKETLLRYISIKVIQGLFSCRGVEHFSFAQNEWEVP